MREFNVCDRIEDNEFADCATVAMARLFPVDPPLFPAKLAHGRHDQGLISRARRGRLGGIIVLATVALQGRAESATREP